MQTETKGVAVAPIRIPIIYVFVFFSGFASLGTEIIGPRLFLSFFGNGTSVWAVMISVALLGLAAGYWVGGRFSAAQARRLLPLILVINAVWLLAAGWIIQSLVDQVDVLGDVMVFLLPFMAFLVPYCLFGMSSPLVIAILSERVDVSQKAHIVGNIYSLSTVGSVFGALTAAFRLIPYVGLVESLRLFALGLMIFAIYFLWDYRRLFAVLGVIGIVVCPLPAFHWQTNDKLVYQGEAFFDTIRVFINEQENTIRMHVGFGNNSSMDRKTGDPKLDYAQHILDVIGNPAGKRVLIIGGAGHGMARILVKRAAQVVEVEIDPIVKTLSDQWFGAVAAETVIADGRPYVDRTPDASFDFVIVDAFTGPASVPPQLTTREFYRSVVRILKPNGRFLYNFIGHPNGKFSKAFKAMATTIAASFRDARASSVNGENIQNVIFVGSSSSMPDLTYPIVSASGGTILTDDLNPIDVLFDQSIDGIYYQHN